METPPEHAYPTHWEADVVLRDGGTAQIRPITPDDGQRLVDFYERVSDESKYYRFFAPYPRLSDRDVHRFTHHDYVNRVGLAATVGDEFIATVRYDRIDERGRPSSAPADEAEVAFLVQDAHQGRGVASALLEHIAAVARERAIRRFAAEVLPANTKMIKVFTDAGYTQQRSFEDGVVRLEFDLEPTARSLAVMRAREQRAEARSVQRLLAPGSVAVVGASRRPGGAGRAVLVDLLSGGYTGRVCAVNHAFAPGRSWLTGADLAQARRAAEAAPRVRAGAPGAPDAVGATPEHPGAEPAGPPAEGAPTDGHPTDGASADEPPGVAAYRSLRDIEEPVDLAVIAVPAEQVPAVVADCGERGVQGLVVVSSGYAESGPTGLERQRELVRQVRSYGMRLIGPGALGIINTADGVRMNASLSPQMPPAGNLGLFTQSGAIGIALLSGLHRRGSGLFGISTFVSAGNRADVSGNDLLQYWHDDPHTHVALLYLESIGNPRKFTRLAKRTAALKPVVVVKGARHSGSEPPGHAVPTTRIPDATVSALFRQAGVIRVDTVTELADVGLFLAAQPLPRGPRVAILGNSESLGLISYDACLTEGLRPLPPLDLTTAAQPADFRAALDRALADDLCDAVVVTAIPAVDEEPATELARAIRESAAASGVPKPVVVVHLEIPGLAAELARPGPPDPWRERPPVTGEPPAGDLAGAPATGGGPVAGSPAASDGPVGGGRVPAYPAAERAVRALAEAVRYAHWRRQAAEPGRVPEYDDIDETGAGADIDVLLAAHAHEDAEQAPPPPPSPVAPPPPPTTPDAPPVPAAAAPPPPAGASRQSAHPTGPAAPGTARVARPAGERGRARNPARSFALSAPDTQRLLARYGISVLPALPAPDPDSAARAAARLGYPVALKPTAPHLRHRADLGAFRLDLGGERELRRAYAELTSLLGGPDELRLVVQRMAPRGVDTVVRAAIDPAAGAVLSFGLAGAPSELLGDTAHRLIPATDRDVAELIRSVRTAPLLFGWRGSRPVDTAALEELLLRVSRLVDDHPEVVAVHLEPVVVAPRGLSVLGASLRLAPPPVRTDLGPRHLPAY
ncbi:GNAT family N-acetyltransferase [Streptomyces sp. 71268]|uniref:bifunctional acetate--CoA ligase family protein/GNAT family N-acetyltransferase n=1 Tax=Streptomyces sp. 71268 TaxID=3002640 RepID=UPI0023F92C0D|nr:GNAT family N-acetyltransferase [Streptomyces sp. 71268]WEV24956.1 GNAT family N-acetyltransferase [Streptomyces sp. 71268]